MKNQLIFLFLFIWSFLQSQTFHVCDGIDGGDIENIKISNNNLTYNLGDSLCFSDVRNINCNQFDRLKCGSSTSIGDYLLIDDKTCYSTVYNFTTFEGCLEKFDLEKGMAQEKYICHPDGLSFIRRYKNKVYVGSNNQYLYVNEDITSGNTWKEIIFPYEVGLTDMIFINDDTYIIGLEHDSFFKGGFAITNDQGKTWRLDTMGIDTRIKDIEYLGENKIMAVGNIGALFFSDNLGQTWRKKIFQPGNFLISSLIIGNDIYVGGGSIVNDVSDSTFIYKSTDGGSSWSLFYYGHGQEIIITMAKDDINRLYAGTSSNFFIYTEESLSKTEDQRTVPISLYPNPTNNILYIRNITDIQSITIYDIMGQQVKSNVPINGDSEDIINFDVSMWKTGVYILQTIDKNGHKSNVRWVKE